MTPSPRTAEGGAGDARNRRLIAAKYLEAAELADTEEGTAANNVVIGIAVLAATERTLGRYDPLVSPGNSRIPRYDGCTVAGSSHDASRRQSRA